MSNYTDILHYSYHHGWILVVGITSVKLSVGFFLLRLVQGKWFKVRTPYKRILLFDSDKFLALHHWLDDFLGYLYLGMCWYTVS